MKVLLDTCSLVWAVSDPAQLGATARALLLTADRRVLEYPHVQAAW